MASLNQMSGSTYSSVLCLIAIKTVHKRHGKEK